MKTPAFCPHCNEPVPPKSKACPHCGADESTGWSDHARIQHLNLPNSDSDSDSDSDFNYDEFVQREFGSESPRPQTKPKHISWFRWAIAILLLILILLPLFNF